MSSVRSTAILSSVVVAGEVEIPGTDFVGNASLTFVDGGLFTLASRGGPPRRELLWMHDLTGTRVGVVS